MQIWLKRAKLCAPGARCSCSSSKISRDLEPATHCGVSTFVTYTVRESDEVGRTIAQRSPRIVPRAATGLQRAQARKNYRKCPWDTSNGPHIKSSLSFDTNPGTRKLSVHLVRSPAVRA